MECVCVYVLQEMRYVSMNIIGDRDNFVWKGHDALPMKGGDVQFQSGFQPVCIIQTYPPAACTALALHSGWQLLVFCLWYVVVKWVSIICIWDRRYVMGYEMAKNSNSWRAPWKDRICSTPMKLWKSLVKPVTRQKTCNNKLFGSSTRDRHAWCILMLFSERPPIYASCMTISGGRTEQQGADCSRLEYVDIRSVGVY